MANVLQRTALVNWSPPANVAGMKELNRAAFRQIFKIPALRIQPKLCSLFLQRLQSKTLNRQRIANIQMDQTNKQNKIILLHPEAQFDGNELKFVNDNHGELCSYNLQIDYDYWSVKDIVRAIVKPDTDQAITSFESIGQVAHVNLRPHLQDYKKLIGNPYLR